MDIPTESISSRDHTEKREDNLLALLKQADRKKGELDNLRPMQPEAMESLQKAFDLELITASNEIEGSTLTLRETQLVLEKGVTIGGKPLRDHLDALNLATAWKLMLELAEAKVPLTESIGLELHKIILTRVDDSAAGRYRTERVFIAGAKHIPPNPLKVPDLMKTAWNEYQTEKPGELNHPIVKLADLHYQISAIHPFKDGNGRTARLLLNLGLLQNGFPPPQILAEEKLEYFEALEAVDTEKETNAFREYTAARVIRSLERYLKALTA